MSVEIVGIITFIFGVAALGLDAKFGFAVLFIFTLLGSAAALIVPGLASIQPAHLLLSFVIIKILFSPGLRRALTVNMRYPGPGFWLLATSIYGLASAYFLPRLFGGHVQVLAVSSPDYVNGMFLIPLVPSASNVTQSVYLTGDLCCFIAFCAIAQSAGGFRMLANAAMAYCVANIGFALLDIAASQTGTSWALAFIRNANYVIYTDSSVGSVKRIIGSFTEASAFAYATIGAFCVATRLWLAGLYRGTSAATAAASLALLILSTSSTAYVSLAPCLGFLYAGAALRLARKDGSANDASFVLFAPLGALSLLLALMLNTAAWDVIADFFEVTIIDKSASASGIERSYANVQAIQTFFDTYGFGAGVGSVRASSLVTASLSNLGLPGCCLYAAFIASLLRMRRIDGDAFGNAIRASARCGCLGLLIAAATSGALIDLGLPFFILAALACAMPVPRSRTPVTSAAPAFLPMTSAA